MMMMDESTKDLVLKKTWCHGQAIAPIYGLICLIWFAHNKSIDLLYAGLLLPIWSYLSYRAVFTEYSFSTLMIGGLLVEVAHGLVFRESLRAGLDQTSHLLMCIASGLFFVETFAFLVVVYAIRKPTSHTTTLRRTINSDWMATSGDDAYAPVSEVYL
jgi:hypothetical protein